MIDTRELQELIENLTDKKMLERAVRNSLNNATEELKFYARANHKFENRTGVLSNSLEHRVNDNSSSIFINEDKAPHGKFIYKGTQDHFIFPKNSNALSFAIGGNRFFSKGHMVKGIKAEPFILNAYNKRKSIFRRQFASDLAEELQEAL